MEKILNIYKPKGATPLEAIEAFKSKHPEYKDIKMGYAGRLDPLAEGVLLVLTGDTLKTQGDYMKLDKEYEAKILLGFETDSRDILGVVQKASDAEYVNKKQAEKILKNIEGKFTAPLPPYSSYRINGKPLFWWARRNKLNEIEVPKKTSQIYKIEVLSIEKIKDNVLLDLVKEDISLVRGDFRQKEIMDTWEKALAEDGRNDYQVVSIRVDCSSGTYIRSLAHEFGVKLKTRAILLHLKRTRVGELHIGDSASLE